MHILFRADANTKMGTGHLHRCLTLADVLKQKLSCDITFATNKLDDGLKALITSKAFNHLELQPSDSPSDSSLLHGHWLSTHYREDFEQIQNYLAQCQLTQFDWLICDHYGLDAKYHNLMYEIAKKIMVIDDLADRMLNCDIVMDQTFNRSEKDYKPLLLRDDCTVLVGTNYALLRPEFVEARTKLQDKTLSLPAEVMVFLGGGDPFNLSGQIVNELITRDRFNELNIHLVVGLVNPFKKELEQLASNYPNIKVLVDCKHMAKLMTECDVAIGASGATSWERCCLGLPSVLVTIADNQKLIAKKLQQAGAVLGGGNAIIKDEFNPKTAVDELFFLIENPQRYNKMRQDCLNICDGKGAARVSEQIRVSSSMGADK